MEAVRARRVNFASTLTTPDTYRKEAECPLVCSTWKAGRARD